MVIYLWCQGSYVFHERPYYGHGARVSYFIKSFKLPTIKIYSPHLHILLQFLFEENPTLVIPCRGMVIFVTRWLTLSPPTIFVENLYKILKILDKFNCFVNFRSMTKRFTQQTANKWISKRLGTKFENCNAKGIFKKKIRKIPSRVNRLTFWP